MPAVTYDYRLPFPAVQPHAAKCLKARFRQTPFVRAQSPNARVYDDVVPYVIP
jgi:hypothetical protein